MWRKRILWGAGLVLAVPVLLLALAALFLTVQAYRAVPDYGRGIVAVGPEAEIEILRDANAIPHAFAQSERDAYFALGFLHGEERLWQMELFRRIASGRVAELVGIPPVADYAVQVDRMARTAGLAHYAALAYPKLSPDVRALIDAYAAGVNAAIDTRDRPLPIEFQLLWFEPEPWRPEDSLMLAKLLAIGLSMDANQEMQRVELAKKLGPEKLAQYLPAYPEGAPVSIADAANRTSEQLVAAAKPLLEALDIGGASNAWAVSGARTESGKTLLATDPHLAMLAPSIWYLAHLSMPERNLVGASMPGLPAMLMGRNDDLAWGFTTTRADVEDIYIEEVNPDDPALYRTPDGWKRFETREERIRVRFGPDETYTVRSTRHGPVLPAGMDATDAAREKGQVLSLAWPLFTADDRTPEALANMARATEWASFNAALRKYAGPIQNTVYADRHGTIAIVAPGRIPIRKPENDTNGLAPVRGWLARNDWAGYIPFDDLPRSVDPASGDVVNANNRLVGPDYPYLISHDWDAPYRAERIIERLGADDALTADDFLSIQLDAVSPFAREILPLLLELGGPEGEELRLLAEWDHAMARNETAPTLFYAWLSALGPAISADELGEEARASGRIRPVFLMNVLTGKDGAGAWCDDVGTTKTETCAEQARVAWQRGLARLEEALGSDRTEWAWGLAHPVVNRSMPLGLVPLVGDLFNIERPSDGGNFTVNRGQTYGGGTPPFPNNHAAGFRAVYDFADLDRSLFMISTGPSGDPASPYYGNLATAWAEGGAIRVPTDREAIEAGAIARQTLAPSE